MQRPRPDAPLAHRLRLSQEVDTHLCLLVGAGAINASKADSAIRLFDDVRAMTWRLLHPRS